MKGQIVLLILNILNSFEMKVTKINPPEMEWVDIKEEGTPKTGNYLVFGKVNIGSPHECFTTFSSKYFEGIGFCDAVGDLYEGRKITHYLRKIID